MMRNEVAVGDVKWSQPELPRAVQGQGRRSGKAQILAVAGVVIAMDVATVVAQQFGR